MLRRILSALVLIPIALAIVVYASPIPYLLILLVIGSFCLYEYQRLIQKMGIGVQRWFGFAGLWFLIVGLQQAWLPDAMVLSSLIIAAFLAALWPRESMRDRALGMMAQVSGIFYLGLGLFPAYAIRFGFGAQTGLAWTLTLLAVIWAGDTAALLAGRKFGRSLLAPRLSPKKTVEGAAAGLLAGAGIAVLLRFFFFASLPLQHVIAASLLTGTFGQLGDLAESMLKRAAEVKESSNLIPGHGGVLDRFDSLLFAFPVLYIYLRFIHPV